MPLCTGWIRQIGPVFDVGLPKHIGAFGFETPEGAFLGLFEILPGKTTLSQVSRQGGKLHGTSADNLIHLEHVDDLTCASFGILFAHIACCVQDLLRDLPGLSPVLSRAGLQSLEPILKKLGSPSFQRGHRNPFLARMGDLMLLFNDLSKVMHHIAPLQLSPQYREQKTVSKQSNLFTLLFIHEYPSWSLPSADAEPLPGKIIMGFLRA